MRPYYDTQAILISYLKKKCHNTIHKAITIERHNKILGMTQSDIIDNRNNKNDDVSIKSSARIVWITLNGNYIQWVK